MAASPSLNEDRSKRGFLLEEEAENYIFSKMCLACQKERQCAINNEKSLHYSPEDEDFIPFDLYPACFSEWVILSEDQFTQKELETYPILKIF